MPCGYLEISHRVSFHPHGFRFVSSRVLRLLPLCQKLFLENIVGLGARDADRGRLTESHRQPYCKSVLRCK